MSKNFILLRSSVLPQTEIEIPSNHLEQLCIYLDVYTFRINLLQQTIYPMWWEGENVLGENQYKPVRLTPISFRTLMCLIMHYPNKVLAQEIIEFVHGKSRWKPSSKNGNVMVYNLKTALGALENIHSSFRPTDARGRLFSDFICNDRNPKDFGYYLKFE